MVQLYTASVSKQCDEALIAEGVDGFLLMQRAAEKTFQVLCDMMTDNSQPVAVLAGNGNNGGDGLIVAVLAREVGMNVTVFRLAEEPMTTAEGAKALLMAQHAQVAMAPLTRFSVADNPMIVDAFFGIGLNRPPDKRIQSIIREINNSPSQVLAVDIPSGLSSDTGTVLGEAFQADKTVTFISRKRGMYTADGPDCCGEIIFSSLVDDEQRPLYEKVTASLNEQGVEILDFSRLLQGLAPRKKNSHKGLFGHCVVAGGNSSMAGAIIMAAEAALAAGCGLLTVITRQEHTTALNARCPEAMTATTPEQMASVFEKADSLAVGPGLGQDAWAKALFAEAYHSDKPLVVDADALAFLTAGNQRNAPLVITPHPGEAARLLGVATADVQADRFMACQLLAEKYNAIVVLKGVGSLIGSGEKQALSTAGNPGMASGGMGDVLTGVVATLLGQISDPFHAAALAMELHGRAGDYAAQLSGQRGLTATDLVPCIRLLLNEKSF